MLLVFYIILCQLSTSLGCLFTTSDTCSLPGLPRLASLRDVYGIRKPCCQAESQETCDYFSASSVSDMTMQTLGQGGMGIVRKVRHPSGQVFAVKTFQPQVREAVDIFAYLVQREFDIASAFDGVPGFARSFALITEVDDHDADHQQAVHMFMEYIPYDMKSFTEHRGPGRRWNDSHIRCIFSQVLGILRTMHDVELAHRDIKPENLLMSRDGRIRLIDFGEVVGTERLSTTFSGTPPYLAPEIYNFRKEAYDAAAADLWGLGMFLMRLYNTHEPWDNSHVSDRKFVGFWQNPSAYLSSTDMPNDVRIALSTLLSPHPDHRYRIHQEWSGVNVTSSHCKREPDGALRLLAQL